MGQSLGSVPCVGQVGVECSLDIENFVQLGYCACHCALSPCIGLLEIFCTMYFVLAGMECYFSAGSVTQLDFMSE